MRLQIAGNIVTPQGIIKNGSVLCDDGNITDILPTNTTIVGYEVKDYAGLMVGPGGIDMHVHGAGGRDFMECKEDAFRTIISEHMKHGTTSIFPTLASSSNEMIREASGICQKLMGEPNSPVMGLHLEGPYFNLKKCGGQMPGMIRLAKPEEYLALLEDCPCIRRWDAAPELEGAMEFARECRKRGILVGIGHTEAEYEDVERGYEAGFSHAVHFYNAMTGVHNVREFKHAGTIESIYLFDGITVEVIADGIHVPPVILRLIHKVKGADRMALVTDAMAPAGIDSTEVFDPNTIIEDGVCKLKDCSALAGSIATMDRLVNTMVTKCGMSWEDTFRMSSTTPARIMAISDRKGSIEKGKDADFCVYTPADAKLTAVIKAGNV